MKKLTYDVPELIKLNDIAMGKVICNTGGHANKGCIPGSSNKQLGGCDPGSTNSGIGGCTTGSGNIGGGSVCITGGTNIS